MKPMVAAAIALRRLVVLANTWLIIAQVLAALHMVAKPIGQSTSCMHEPETRTLLASLWKDRNG
jgi:hypothetical protein